VEFIVLNLRVERQAAAESRHTLAVILEVNFGWRFHSPNVQESSCTLSEID